MSKQALDSSDLLDRQTTTPMKSVVLAAQTTLAPAAQLATSGSEEGLYKFSGFDPAVLTPILTMEIVPRYRIQIQDIYIQSNGAAVAGENIIVEKINALGVALPVATLTFAGAGAILEIIPYTVATPLAVLANFTVDPALGEFIRVRSPGPAGVTNGATATIIFSMV